MPKTLIIVESPTKAKTISKFLGSDYKITSSYGHLRDLPERSLGVDVEHNFEPKYVVAKDKKPIVDELKKQAKTSSLIYLATDADREGEAIAWHLSYLLQAGRKKNNYKRIAFHEITKSAILEALANPRELDQNLVNAQQARRVLDRLVGYKLSPFLWKKVAKGLSAGRVQSAAVRLIVDREREIIAFKPEEYWSLQALLRSNDQPFEAFLNKIDGQKLDKLAIGHKQKMDEILDDLNQAEYIIEKIFRKKIDKKPPIPFITSSLQQEAHNKFGFSSRQTMYIAQSLYEGVKIGKTQTGLITYMRTDSLNLSDTFLNPARDYIQNEFGPNYLPTSAVKYKTKSKSAQEAHEAIRPTDATLLPAQIESHLDHKQFKLYQLIWQRSIASQMNPAQIDNTGVDIKAGRYEFRATGSIIKFDGFLKVYPAPTKENILPELVEHQPVTLDKLEPKQHFTEPPPRYNDASLVKAMEELDIGRPSTYAPTLSTIQARNYVKRDQGRFIPQEIAFIVTDLLVEHFPEIVDYQFTAQMENDLDHVADGRKQWIPVIKKFYTPFINNLDKKYMEIDKKELTETKSDVKCDKCGRDMVIKTSRYGKFLACTGFPDCKNTKSLDENGKVDEHKRDDKPEPEITDMICEKCGKPMVIRQGKFGKFYACSGFPKCRNTKALDQDTGVDCPQCGKGKIVAKKTKSRKTFYACDQYPNCKFALWSRPTGDKCPKCGALMVNAGQDQAKCSNEKCGNKR